MKYCITTYTIRDGDFEYMTQTPSAGRTIEEAQEEAVIDTREWIKHDYREIDDIRSQEITKEEYDIIKKYIY